MYFFLFQLLTVSPSENSLALVYRDKATLRFVKQVNHRILGMQCSDEFYDFSTVYYEWICQLLCKENKSLFPTKLGFSSTDVALDMQLGKFVDD